MIIKGSIKEAAREIYTMDKFPGPDEANKQGWIPASLNVFLSSLIRSDVKVESLGQCIIKAALPSSTIPPIPFALGVEVDHITARNMMFSEIC